MIRLGHWSTGDLDGKGGVDAVAITVEEPRSGGTFYYLHSLVERDGALHGTDVEYLGERIRIGGVSIHGGLTGSVNERLIRVAMLLLSRGLRIQRATGGAPRGI